MKAIVVGGGAAGIAAACRLAEQGAEVLLLERTPRLGGRAASFAYRKMEEEVDYGAHVLMRCFTETRSLFARLGMQKAVSVQKRLHVSLRSTQGGGSLVSAPLPGIFHLLPSVLRYRPLRFRDRLLTVRAGLPLLCSPLPEDREFGGWLRRHGQGPSVMAHFWEPICNATLNGHADTLSVSAAGKVFKEGFFRPHGAGLGFFALPLSRVFSAAGSFLHDHGGAVRLQTTVTRILIKKNRAYGVEFVNGERIGSEWIISAVPPFDLLSLLPPAVAANPPFDRVAALQWSPIVNLHLWFDRSVMDEFFFVAVGSPLQVVFNVSRIQGKKGPAHIVVSQSAATEWLDLPLDEIRDRLLTALGALLPAVQGARLLDSLVVKNPRATFLPAPGIEVLRPASRTPIERLLLAGDFTATGWPSTIEGAVRSGNAAARLVSD